MLVTIAGLFAALAAGEIGSRKARSILRLLEIHCSVFERCTQDLFLTAELLARGERKEERGRTGGTTRVKNKRKKEVKKKSGTEQGGKCMRKEAKG